MPAVPRSAVLDAWNELNQEDADPAAFAARFAVAQPVLSGWLRAAEDGIAGQDDRGLLYFLGIWIWLAFTRAGGATTEVTEDRILAAWENNVREMEELNAAPESRWLHHARAMTRDYRQGPLLAAVTEAVMDPGLTDKPRTDDLSGLIILHAKSVIDALDD